MQAEAAPRWGVSATTPINNQVSINAVNISAPVTDVSIDTTVDTIHAVLTLPIHPEEGDTYTSSKHLDINVGDTVRFEYQVFNHGNASDSFIIYLSGLTLSEPDTMTGWSNQLIDSSGNPRGDSFVIGPIAEEGSETFSVEIQASSVPDSVPNDEYAFCTVIVEVYSGSKTNAYQGDNLVWYAIGNDTMIFYDTATVSAAIFTVSQTCTGATIDGTTSDPFPGASLWYEIEYENIGSGEGRNVFLFVRIDTASVEFADTVFNTASDSWTFHYCTAPIPAVFEYGDANEHWTAGVPDNPEEVTYIKWDRAIVDGNETGKLGYRVIIK